MRVCVCGWGGGGGGGEGRGGGSTTLLWRLEGSRGDMGGQGGASGRWNHLFAITTQKAEGEKAELTLKEVKTRRHTQEEVGRRGGGDGGEKGRVSTCLSSQHRAKRIRTGTTQGTFIAWLVYCSFILFPTFFLGGEGVWGAPIPILPHPGGLHKKKGSGSPTQGYRMWLMLGENHICK